LRLWILYWGCWRCVELSPWA